MSTLPQGVTWDDCISKKTQYENLLIRTQGRLNELASKANQHAETTALYRINNAMANLAALNQNVHNETIANQHRMVPGKVVSMDEFPIAYLLESSYSTAISELNQTLESFKNE